MLYAIEKRVVGTNSRVIHLMGLKEGTPKHA
jgi:hypothetical protein